MTDEQTTSLRKWGDDQQYEQAQFQAQGTEQTGVLPRVHLLWMTPDPLGAIAAACRMYEGKPTYDLNDITDEERKHYWQQAQATHLKAPLEFVKFHFFIEGVDRAFTHQMVRQRTAVYAQESMRFAVVEELDRRSTLPPSLYGTISQQTEDRHASHEDNLQRARDVWDDAIENIGQVYTQLVERGMPAEEARGLLPHAAATRLNYSTDLRALLDHAGNRLCTQAQFHWRLVFNGIAQAIRGYQSDGVGDWQFKELSKVFKPVCYQLGHCPFQASFDRDCSIRERVEANAKHGRPSEKWGQEFIGKDSHGNRQVIGAIHDSEWMLDPDAARRRADKTNERRDTLVQLDEFGAIACPNCDGQMWKWRDFAPPGRRFWKCADCQYEEERD